MRTTRPPSRGRCLTYPFLAVLASLGVASCGDDAMGPAAEITRLAVVLAPATVVTGQAFGVAPVVELRSADGRPVETSGVTVRVAADRGVLGGTRSATTDERGRAEFSDLSIAGDPGSVRLAFSCCDVPATIATLTLAQGSGLFAVSPTSVTGKVGGQVFGVAVRALNDQMRPIAGVAVRFQLDSERLPAASITTGTDGAARLPTFALSLMAGTEMLTATDVTTGESVTFELVSTPDPKVVVLDAGLEPVVAVGSTVTLPALRLTNGLPDQGAAVSYRVIAGGGVLSKETAMTDATGTSEPVTLTLAERGTTTVEISAVGYEPVPGDVTVRAVIPPVAFAYPDPCPEFATCPPLEFSYYDGYEMYFEIEVRDAIGPLVGFPIELTPSGDAGWIGSSSEGYSFDLTYGGDMATGETGVFWFWWLNSHGGTHTFTLSGPLIDTPWTYRATP